MMQDSNPITARPHSTPYPDVNAALLILIAVELVTTASLPTLLSVHVFVGVLLAHEFGRRADRPAKHADASSVGGFEPDTDQDSVKCCYSISLDSTTTSATPQPLQCGPRRWPCMRLRVNVWGG